MESAHEERLMNIDQHPSTEIKLRREILLLRIEALTEFPLMILSIVMIPLLVGPFFWDMSAKSEQVFLALNAFIWALFAVDMVVKVLVSTKKIRYVRSHWLEILAVLVPWFRPLRVVRVIIFAVRSYRGLTRIGKPDFLLIYAIALVVVSATLVTTLEQHQSSPLATFDNSLWWAIVTITTVGYGDMVPVTNAGRAIAFVVMLGGIGIFGAITANLASMFSRSDSLDTDLLVELKAEIQSLRQEVASINRA
jgi:voltage-gated potassium channel